MNKKDLNKINLLSILILTCALLSSCGDNQSGEPADNTSAEIAEEINNLETYLGNSQLDHLSYGFTTQDDLIRPCGDFNQRVQIANTEILRIETKYNNYYTVSNPEPYTENYRYLKNEIKELKDFIVKLDKNINAYCDRDDNIIQECSQHDDFVKITINQNISGQGFVHPYLLYKRSSQTFSYDREVRYTTSSQDKNGYILFYNATTNAVTTSASHPRSNDVRRNDEILSTVSCLKEAKNKIKSSLGKIIINSMNVLAKKYNL